MKEAFKTSKQKIIKLKKKYIINEMRGMINIKFVKVRKLLMLKGKEKMIILVIIRGDALSGTNSKLLCW